MVSSISNAVSWLSQLSHVGNTKAAAATSAAAYLNGADRSVETVRKGGGMMEAIATSLAQIGVDAKTESAASGAAASADGTDDSSQLLTSFMHTLMTALHEQSGDQVAAAADGSADASGVSGATQASVVGRSRPDLEADLQSLIQKVATVGEEAADSAVSALQDGFASLESALGETNATLSDFLQAFSKNLAGTMTSGNVIKALA